MYIYIYIYIYKCVSFAEMRRLILLCKHVTKIRKLNLSLWFFKAVHMWRVLHGADLSCVLVADLSCVLVAVLDFSTTRGSGLRKNHGAKGSDYSITFWFFYLDLFEKSREHISLQGLVSKILASI